MKKLSLVMALILGAATLVQAKEITVRGKLQKTVESGGWLIAASWLLHVQNSSAKINFVVVGALVAIFAVYKLWFGVGEKQDAIGRLDS